MPVHLRPTDTVQMQNEHRQSSSADSAIHLERLSMSQAMYKYYVTQAGA